MKISGIILAAGRGSRLKRFTKKEPKSFYIYNNKRIIDLILENFKFNKIKNISLVLGYRRKSFKNYNYNKILNLEWNKSNIFYSLYKARKILSKNHTIISYADIIFKKEAIKKLKEQKGDLVILNYTNWQQNWKNRYKKPLKDLETFKFSKKNKINYLTAIGKKTSSYKDINGQFCGLFKISPRGWMKIEKFIKEKKVNIKKIDITSLLSKFLETNKKVIQVVNYSKEWFEVDTISDLKFLMANEK